MTERGIRPDARYRRLGSELLCRSEVVTVHREHIRLPHGHEMHQDLIELPAAVAVVPILDGEREDEEPRVVLVEQFRNSVRGHMHELPAGVVDPGEAPEECARRELQEETGYRAGRLESIGARLMIPGTSAHRLHFFLARDLEPGSQALDAAEWIEVRRLPLFSLARDLVEGGPLAETVVDAKTHLGALHAAARLRGAGRRGA